MEVDDDEETPARFTRGGRKSKKEEKVRFMSRFRFSICVSRHVRVQSSQSDGGPREFSESMQHERARLLSDGFVLWIRKDFQIFLE